MPPPIRKVRRSVWLLPLDGPRGEIAGAIVERLRRRGLPLELPASGWEDHHGQWRASSLAVGQLVTSAHPTGFVQVRVRLRVILLPLLLALSATGVLLSFNWVAGSVIALWILAELGLAWWRSHAAVEASLGEGQDAASPPRVGAGRGSSDEMAVLAAAGTTRLDLAGRRHQAGSSQPPAAAVEER